MGDKLSVHIDLCRKGYSGAFGYIVTEYQQLVYTLSFRLLCNEDDAKDATQEAFIRAWRNISKYKQQYKFSTWIYKITSNVCYDKMRSDRRVSKIDLSDCDLYSEAGQDDLLNNKELKELIINITKGLTPKQKLVFTLSDLEELEFEEISIITGLTPAKIKSNLYLARKYIKSKIANHDKY